MNENAQRFTESILKLAPKSAAFDCDGTIWDADSGMQFFYWLLDHHLVTAETEAWARPRYQQYLAGRVDEETMCGEMVQICRGLRVPAIREAAKQFFEAKVRARIFPEMLELTNRLRDQGCELWAVSSSNQWLIEIEAAPFGFVADHVFAAEVAEENGVATDRLLRVPTGPSKAAVLKKNVPAGVEFAFGNSIHDAAMLESAKKRAFAINPNEDLEFVARARGWTVYYPVSVVAP